MLDKDQRQHTRQNENAIISFGFLHQTPRFLGFVKNVSQYGLYFVTEKPLSIGSLVSIQPWRCESSSADSLSPSSRQRADVICSQARHNPRRLNAMVIGKVVHCRRLDDQTPASYGIGAHYESPSV